MDAETPDRPTETPTPSGDGSHPLRPEVVDPPDQASGWCRRGPGRHGGGRRRGRRTRRVHRAAGQGAAHRLDGQAAAGGGAPGAPRRGQPGPPPRDLRAVDPGAGRGALARPGRRAGPDVHPLRLGDPVRRRAADRPRPAGGLAGGPVPRHPGHAGGPAGGGPGPAGRDAPAVAAPGTDPTTGRPGTYL